MTPPARTTLRSLCNAVLLLAGVAVLFGAVLFGAVGLGAVGLGAVGLGAVGLGAGPLYLFAALPPPFDVLDVADRPDLVTAGQWTQRVIGMTVMAVTAVLLVPLTAIVVAPVLGGDPALLYVVQVTGLGLVPLAFLWSPVRGGFARSGQLEELGARAEVLTNAARHSGAAEVRVLAEVRDGLRRPSKLLVRDGRPYPPRARPRCLPMLARRRRCATTTSC